jgi:hypothetical protein
MIRKQGVVRDPANGERPLARIHRAFGFRRYLSGFIILSELRTELEGDFSRIPSFCPLKRREFLILVCTSS